MEIYNLLIEKSKEAFVLAIEIYNKPSIKYRLEGFSFFICNAWELMLKAHIINASGEDAIYYKDKPDRTISLTDCVKRVFTNEKSPIHMNLMKIAELRNTSTHFITTEYEMVYIPLLQACVFNFVEKMKEFHNVDMSEIIPENFLMLSVRTDALDEAAIRGKYPKQISERLINTRAAMAPMIDANNSNFAIRVEHQYFNTKNPSKATEFYHIAKNAEEGIRTVKEIKNPNDTHKYTTKDVITEIKKRLVKAGIQPLCKGEPVVFNMYHFSLFAAYYNLKENERYCFTYTVGNKRYSYSMQAIEFIFNEIRKDPENIIDNLKEYCSRNKKS